MTATHTPTAVFACRDLSRWRTGTTASSISATAGTGRFTLRPEAFRTCDVAMRDVPLLTPDIA
ncbi:hypothetical protein [Sphingomonas endophytica]|uniref:Uncharacterized protein n=1 Tax=Sphingomonas endophytica TaxID=869719 RepID=A0A147I258_9SPHN|nr:hypothetical protein [Sphingomonas endophytica]KTT71757.1 hypothetical protein NS334_09955 [Sphingomonas endophytica]